MLARLVDALIAVLVLAVVYTVLIFLFNVATAPAAVFGEAQAKLHDSEAKVVELQGARPEPALSCYVRLGVGDDTTTIDPSPLDNLGELRNR